MAAAASFSVIISAENCLNLEDAFKKALTSTPSTIIKGPSYKEYFLTHKV
jgi:hypothetical protein